MRCFMKPGKTIFCGLFVLLMMCIVTVSAAPTLSVDLIASPEQAAPGEPFSLNILVNHNGNGEIVDHSTTWIEYDPTYITMTNLPISMSSPIGSGGTCDLSAGPKILCAWDTWGFGAVVNNGLLFGTPLTGKINDNTPLGTVINLKTCMHAVYDIDSPNVPIDVCDESHSITVTETTNAPEFPSIFLPVTMIIGLLGAVLYIQRTREL